MKVIILCFAAYLLLPPIASRVAGAGAATPANSRIDNASASAGGMNEDRYKSALEKSLATMRNVIANGPYKDTVESLDNYCAPEWYADAKLGIFIHYGLFSVPGFSGVGCWYGNQMYDPRASAFAFHRQEYGSQDTFGYKDFAPYLTASRFDADEWVSLFKEAGARFVVPVSCFHDGFAMWNSKLTDWNAVKTGPRRDYDGLLSKAARKQGMKFGVAWHAFFRRFSLLAAAPAPISNRRMRGRHGRFMGLTK